MRAIRPMTDEEREFAEQNHDLVNDFLRCKRLPMDDYYDVVIFGYLSAVQQYFRNPPIGVEFRAMAFRAMRDSVLREGEYNSRAKRLSYIVSLEDLGSHGTHDTIPDPKQDIERQVESMVLLEQAVSTATPREASILRLLVDGFALHDVARFLKIPKTTAASCMEDFCWRAEIAIG